MPFAAGPVSTSTAKTTGCPLALWAVQAKPRRRQALLRRGFPRSGACEQHAKRGANLPLSRRVLPRQRGQCPRPAIDEVTEGCGRYPTEGITVDVVVFASHIIAAPEASMIDDGFMNNCDTVCLFVFIFFSIYFIKKCVDSLTRGSQSISLGGSSDLEYQPFFLRGPGVRILKIDDSQTSLQSCNCVLC